MRLVEDKVSRRLGFDISVAGIYLLKDYGVLVEDGMLPLHNSRSPFGFIKSVFIMNYLDQHWGLLRQGTGTVSSMVLRIRLHIGSIELSGCYRTHLHLRETELKHLNLLELGLLIKPWVSALVRDMRISDGAIVNLLLLRHAWYQLMASVSSSSSELSMAVNTHRSYAAWWNSGLAVMIIPRSHRWHSDLA